MRTKGAVATAIIAKVKSVIVRRAYFLKGQKGKVKG